MPTKNSKTPTKYVTTFTLTQDGMDGDIHSKLTFNPLVENQNPEDEAPLAFQQMSWLVEMYLREIGLIDDTGNLLTPDKFHDENSMEVTTLRSIN